MLLARALLDTFLPASAAPPVVFPAFGAAGTGYGNGSANATHAVPLPTGIVAGHFLLLHVQVRSGANDSTCTTPAGWTRFSGNPSGTGNVRVWAFWRIATGTEGTTVSVTTTGSVAPTFTGARAYRLSGAHATAPIEGFVSASGTVNPITAPSLTLADAGRLGVSLIAVAAAGTIGAYSGAAGGVWTEPVAEFSTTAGADGTLQIQVVELAGAISGGSVSHSVSTAWTRLGFMLAPAGGVPPPAAPPGLPGAPP